MARGVYERFLLEVPLGRRADSIAATDPSEDREESGTSVIVARRTADPRLGKSQDAGKGLILKPFMDEHPTGGTAMPEANTVYIGKKPTMNYVLAVVTHFNSGTPEVVVKARGRSISRAVDVAEIVRNRFVPGSKVKDVRIATEKLTGEDGRAASVSSIEIYLAR
jgi:DNA-binding protein